MESKCLNCKYGALLQGVCRANEQSLFQFTKAIKSKGSDIVEINYANGESGCRMTERNEIEDKCIQNNYSEFEQFYLLNNNVRTLATWTQIK